MLDMKPALDHWKASGVDLANVLHPPAVAGDAARHQTHAQDHGLDDILDRQIIAAAWPAIEGKRPVNLAFPIRNANRATGTMLGYEITRRHGGAGLPDDTISLQFTGSAGQSFGAFVPRGMTMVLIGDANDGFGKGLSGGKVIAFPPKRSTFKSEENIIVGNVALYGATAGEAYIRGMAGERFCVRNSGAHVVVEGVGDHGCEYMTGGRVVVLGRTGRNFAAGMSGGIAYVLDREDRFTVRCNREMVDLEPIIDADDIDFVRVAIMKHATLTGSRYAESVLAGWAALQKRFVKVMPRDYKRALAAEARRREDEAREALLVAAPVAVPKVRKSKRGVSAKALQQLHG
jgi:glutamate synthase (ferredoxin)